MSLLLVHAVEKMYVRFAAFLSDVEAFDTELFRYASASTHASVLLLIIEQSCHALWVYNILDSCL